MAVVLSEVAWAQWVLSECSNLASFVFIAIEKHVQRTGTVQGEQRWQLCGQTSNKLDGFCWCNTVAQSRFDDSQRQQMTASLYQPLAEQQVKKAQAAHNTGRA